MKTTKYILKITFAATLVLNCIYLAGCSHVSNEKATASIAGKVFTLEIAADPDSRYQGLSGRAPLRDDQGMLFIYPSPRVLKFCMRDCYHPIDIMFADADGKIIQTYAMTPELDLIRQSGIDKDWKTYSSKTEAVYALEVREGLIAQLKIKPGDKLIFKNVPSYKRAKEE